MFRHDQKKSIKLKFSWRKKRPKHTYNTGFSQRHVSQSKDTMTEAKARGVGECTGQKWYSCFQGLTSQCKRCCSETNPVPPTPPQEVSRLSSYRRPVIDLHKYHRDTRRNEPVSQYSGREEVSELRKVSSVSVGFLLEA